MRQIGNSTIVSISQIYLTKEKSSFLQRMNWNTLSGEGGNITHHLLHPVTTAKEAHPTTQFGREAKQIGDLKLFLNFRVNLYYLTKKKRRRKQSRKREREMREREKPCWNH